MNRRLIVAITGASGVVYGVRLLEILASRDIETHLILTDAARTNLTLETDRSVGDVVALAYRHYDNGDLAAYIASGSFFTDAMIVVPCSIKSLSGIANCYGESLVVRAADVTLKEGRKLILVVRETPLHKGHLRLMSAAADMGAQILPPMPAFYHHPKSVSDIIDQSVGKMLDQLHIEHDLFRRWGDPSEA